MHLSSVWRGVRKRMALSFLVAGMVLGAPFGATAETPEAGERGGVSSSYSLEPVVVTAEKRKTDVQKTPVAVTVFTAQDLEDNNDKTLREVLARVPNLVQVDQIGSNTMVGFRGAITSMGTETTPIVIYIDGVPVDSYSSLDASLLNIERIEVLRGAQSALYGKNAFAGVVNIISRKPDNTPTGKAFAGVGSEFSSELGATTSGPIFEDTLFYSLSASHDYRDGYMDGAESNHKRNIRLKGQLRLLPTDDSELNLHVGLKKYREGVMPVVSGESPSFETPSSDGDHRTKDTLSLALHGAWDFSATELRSITTYRKDSMDASHNTDPYLSVPGYYNEYEESSSEVTQEFRLQSPEDSESGFSWLVGLYGGYREFERTKWYTPALTMNFPHTDKLAEFAPFGQVVVPLFADGLNLTAGLRWLR